MLLFPHLDLRCAQSRCRAFAMLQHLLVELRHQVGSCFVVHAPQTHNDASRARIHKAPRQPDQSFALDVFAETGLASAQNHQFSGQLEVVDVIGAQEAVLLFALLVHSREDQRRQPWSFAV